MRTDSWYWTQPRLKGPDGVLLAYMLWGAPAARARARALPVKLQRCPRNSWHPSSLCAVNYISKPTEFLDTYFMVVKGNYRQISYLHVSHHAIMPIIMYILIDLVRWRLGGRQSSHAAAAHASVREPATHPLRRPPPSPRPRACPLCAVPGRQLVRSSARAHESPANIAPRHAPRMCASPPPGRATRSPPARPPRRCFGPMINSFVHTIMYGYYCLTGLGVTANFVKPLITTVQMTQFVVLAAQSTYAIADGYRYWPATIAWVSTALMVQMLVLFGNFAMQAYCPRKGRGAGGGGAKDD